MQAIVKMFVTFIAQQIVIHINSTLRLSEANLQSSLPFTFQIKTYGSLDLGGASTQVTFSPFQRKQNREIVEIGNKKYKLYAKSYLSYGTKEIHNRFLRFLGQSGKKDRDGNIESPCHHDGLKETFEVNNLLINFTLKLPLPCALGADNTSPG